MIPVAFEDFRELARRRLPKMFFDYIDGGSIDGQTLARNRQGFADLTLRQRVLQDMSTPDLATEVLGQPLAMPLILAPVGLAGVYHRRGEAQAAKAAKAAGLAYTLSTVGVCDIDEVAAAAPAPWFQLYLMKDRGFIEALLQRAWAAGSPVLMFTVDLPVAGLRYRDANSGLNGKGLGVALKRLGQGMTRPGWAWDVAINGGPLSFGNIAAAVPEAKGLADFWGWIGKNTDPGLRLSDIDWIRQRWPGKLVIKGVLDVEDARAVAAAGVDGIVVSNHGGRQLNGTHATIQALPAIVDAVGDHLDVILDSGVRNGGDILKALALGAKACMVGRPWAFALAAGGEAGVTQLLGNFRRELVTDMILTGCGSIAEAGPHLLDRPVPAPPPVQALAPEPAPAPVAAAPTAAAPLAAPKPPAVKKGKAPKNPRILIHHAAWRRIEARLAALPKFQPLVMSEDGAIRLGSATVSIDEAQPDAGWISHDIFGDAHARSFWLALLGAKSIAWAHSGAAGFDNPAFGRLAAKRLTLTTNHAQAVAISEYVLAGVLTHFQRTSERREAQAQRQWRQLPFREIAASHWLIVGFGSIGQAIAKRAGAFGAHVTGVRRTAGAHELADEMVALADVKTALPQADVVVLSVPLSAATKGLADAGFFAAMKPGSVFINVGRGGLTDEAALLDALQKDRPEHAILDVFAVEPLPADSPFWRHPKVSLTPHSASMGSGQVTRSDAIFLANLTHYLTGEPVEGAVDLAEVKGQLAGAQ